MMSDPDDFLNRPGRPQHPDFWKLSDLQLALDGEATEGGRSAEQIVGEIIDIEVLTYWAKQRLLFFGVTRPSPGWVAFYLDAFTTGARWQERKTAKGE